jgi:hypothetical protein
MATISPCAVGSFSCLPIAAFNHHLAVTHDHAAEGIVAARGFRDGHPHEALVVRLHRLRDPARLRRRRHEQGGRGDRQSQSSNRARDQSPAAHIFGWRCDAISTDAVSAHATSPCQAIGVRSYPTHHSNGRR